MGVIYESYSFRPIIEVLMKFQLALIATVFMFAACEQKPADTVEPTPLPVTAAQVAPEEAKPEPAAPADAAPLALLAVTAEGTTFDPAVKPEQIPAGAWYCDMGTVEFARLEKGDGKCPACGMMLKEKTADGAAAPGANDHDGHDHAGHDHAGHDH
jgi:hypothetical protein